MPRSCAPRWVTPRPLASRSAYNRYRNSTLPTILRRVWLRHNPGRPPVRPLWSGCAKNPLGTRPSMHPMLESFLGQSAAGGALCGLPSARPCFFLCHRPIPRQRGGSGSDARVQVSGQTAPAWRPWALACGRLAGFAAAGSPAPSAGSGSLTLVEVAATRLQSGGPLGPSARSRIRARRQASARASTQPSSGSLPPHRAGAAGRRVAPAPPGHGHPDGFG